MFSLNFPNIIFYNNCTKKGAEKKLIMIIQEGREGKSVDIFFSDGYTI
jgi:hypothetical protein